MKYRITLSLAVDAGNDQQAHDYAKKLRELLRSPLVKMAVEGDGIKLSGDGRVMVHQPQREIA